MKTVIMLLICFFFAGCESSPPTSYNLTLSGDYSGVFYLTYQAGTDSGMVSESNAFFTFSDTGWYSCKGSTGILPRGGGFFNVKNDSLHLMDLYLRTALFDGSLVLNGAFYISHSGGTLILTQEDKNNSRFRRIELTLQ